MFRSCFYAILTLVILFIMGGCASKTAKTDDAIAPPQVAVSDNQPDQAVENITNKAEVQNNASDPLVDAGFFKVDLGDMSTVFFEYDSYQLTPEALAVLKDNAEWLQANSAFKASIEGHCDERGSDEYNMALGELRAYAVRNYLASLGVAEDRLRIISYGEERAAVIGTGEDAWAKNRRVEFN